MNERKQRYVRARQEGLSKTAAAAAAGYSASSGAALRAAAAKLERDPGVAEALGKKPKRSPAKAAPPTPAAAEPLPVDVDSLSEDTLRRILSHDPPHPPYVLVQAASALSRIEGDRRKAAQASAPPPTPLVVFLEPGMGSRAPTREEVLGHAAQLATSDWRWVVEEMSKPRQRVVSIRSRRRKAVAES